jgi:AraC-like DNA-binding protein
MSFPFEQKVETAEAEVYQRLCRARAYIDHCYDHPLSLDQISSQACFSRYHFLRLFRQAFNKTPHQYLIERRIEKAKELLSADELRSGRVLPEVGFQAWDRSEVSLQVRRPLAERYRGRAGKRRPQNDDPRMLSGDVWTRTWDTGLEELPPEAFTFFFFSNFQEV